MFRTVFVSSGFFAFLIFSTFFAGFVVQSICSSHKRPRRICLIYKGANNLRSIVSSQIFMSSSAPLGYAYKNMLICNIRYDLPISSLSISFALNLDSVYHFVGNDFIVIAIISDVYGHYCLCKQRRHTFATVKHTTVAHNEAKRDKNYSYICECIWLSFEHLSESIERNFHGRL